jgi:hypothetical protein
MSLLDPKWKYTHSTATDIRKTFAKARRALAQQQKAELRPSKPHLVCAPSETAAPFGTRPKSLLFGTRGMPVDGVSDLKDESAGRHTATDRRSA